MVRTYWAVIIACLSLGWSAAQTRELVLFPFAQGAAVQPTDEFNVNVERSTPSTHNSKRFLASMCYGSVRRTHPSPARWKRTAFGATA